MPDGRFDPLTNMATSSHKCLKALRLLAVLFAMFIFYILMQVGFENAESKISKLLNMTYSNDDTDFSVNTFQKVKNFFGSQWHYDLSQIYKTTAVRHDCRTYILSPKRNKVLLSCLEGGGKGGLVLHRDLCHIRYSKYDGQWVCVSF